MFNPIFRPPFDNVMRHVFEAGKFDPALSFDLTSALPAGITFTRASDGTALNSSATLFTAGTDVARFDHNASGAPLGLLLERQGENLFRSSENLSGTGWTNLSSTISADAAVAPDGLTTADKYILPSGVGSGSSSLRQTISKAASSLTYVVSLFSKADEHNTVRFLFRDSASAANNAQAWFNLTSGTISSGPSAAGTFSNASAQIIPYPNGWYRCVLIATTGTETSIDLRVLQYLNNAVQTGDDTKGLFVWGVDTKQNDTLTSYVPTTSAAVTRAVDSATFSTDLTTSGTILIEHDVPSGDIILGEGANTVLTSTGAGTLAISFDGTRSQSCLNGGAVSSGAGLTLGATLRLLGSSAVQSIGHVKRYQEFDRIMSGAELRQISK
jgi:hypothetical protein